MLSAHSSPTPITLSWDVLQLGGPMAKSAYAVTHGHRAHIGSFEFEIDDRR